MGRPCQAGAVLNAAAAPRLAPDALAARVAAAPRLNSPRDI